MKTIIIKEVWEKFIKHKDILNEGLTKRKFNEINHLCFNNYQNITKYILHLLLI
jgi:hypothetical protein